MNTLALYSLYRPMMTLFREQATSRSNLKIVYVGKSIITMSKNVVKHFILSLVVVLLLTFTMSFIYIVF
jgi:type III secretory pathway component EscU